MKLFFVAKKDGKLRLVIDCRRSNQHFRTPPCTRLFSGAGFTEVCADKGAELYFAGVDVKCAFYQHAIPSWLSELFCLDGIKAGELGISSVDGQPVEPNRTIYPQLAVVPMGWSWALALVQAAHENLLDESVLLSRSRRAVDFAPPPKPRDGVVHSLYVDNVICEGHDPQEVTAARVAASEILEKAGLTVHDETDASLHMDTLGVEQCGSPPCVGLSPKRYWKLYHALGHLAETRGRCTSRALEKVVGHWTFAALLRRELLCSLRAVYDFIRADYRHEQPIWRSVRRELSMMRGLLVFTRRDLSGVVSTKAWAFDACESGHASVTAQLGKEQVQSMVEWHERWRYKEVDDLTFQPVRGSKISNGSGSYCGAVNIARTCPVSSLKFKRVCWNRGPGRSIISNRCSRKKGCISRRCGATWVVYVGCFVIVIRGTNIILF